MNRISFEGDYKNVDIPGEMDSQRDNFNEIAQIYCGDKNLP